MHAPVLCRVVVLSALCSLAGAQSFEGDTFNYEVIGSTLDKVSGTAVVGPGPEFTIDGTLAFYTVDIGPSSITITADLDFPPPAASLWGGNGSEILGALRLTNLNYTNGDTIAGISVSGTADELGPSDTEFTPNGISVGDTTKSNVIRFSSGEQVVVTVMPDDCPGPEVTNLDTGQGFMTLAAAIAAASDGQTLEIGPCTLEERGLEIDGLDLTLRGHGSEVSKIDGQGQPGRLLTVTNGANVTVESVGFVRGLVDLLVTQGVVTVQESHAVFSDCLFADNETPDALTSTLVVDSASVVVQRSLFRDCTGADITLGSSVYSFSVAQQTELSFVNCLFSGSGPADAVVNVFSTNLKLVNCTFADNLTDVGVGFTGETENTVSNCVFDRASAFAAPVGPPEGVSRNVFPGASAGNIDATPDFIDADGGDYRLAPGSPGIDAANADAYADTRAGILDLAGLARARDDAGTMNTGVGTLQFLDAGAYEFQGTSVSTDAFDVNGDGTIDVFDLISFVEGLEALQP